MLLFLIHGLLARRRRALAVHVKAEVSAEDLGMPGVRLVSQAIIQATDDAIEHPHLLMVLLLRPESPFEGDFKMFLHGGFVHI